jgi:hypothetical protein
MIFVRGHALAILLLTLLAFGAGSAAAQTVTDGGFEAGPSSGAWIESSTQFGSPLCSEPACGISSGTGPASGTYWAWFGGYDGREVGALEQGMVFPATGWAILTFELEHPNASGNGQDDLRVLIDGLEVFRLAEGTAGYEAYRRVRLDLSAWADGASHTLRFHSESWGGGISSFFVDDVALDTDPPGLPPPLPPEIFADGFESGDTSAWTETSAPLCGQDTDGDRLSDCAETGTGVFIDPDDTGTDPNLPDTDGDGLDDGDEVLGTEGFLDLPSMGANPLRKNILLEYDWFNDALEGCIPHSHRPTSAMISRVAAAFANAPVANPDGSTGITLIQDYGQGGIFSGGNFIADPDGVIDGGVTEPEFQSYKAAHFAPERLGYFHYVLLPHRYNTSSPSSGQAEVPGDDMIVSLACLGNTVNVANTIMHELGHNLQLQHGGNESCNYKPNYNSVMNYRYQFAGVDTDCTPPGDGLLDYSSDTRLTLNETFLAEWSGICGAPPWDWDGDGVIDSARVVVDINSEDVLEEFSCGGFLTLLRDFDDWANLLYAGLPEPAGGGPLTQEIITCEPEVPPGEPARPLARKLPAGAAAP